MIPQHKWKWFGYPLHFIASDSCRFRMGTLVGKFIISTVGDMFLNGKLVEVGCDRKYETMVFEYDSECSCGCGKPNHDGSELEMRGYNDAKSATEGHLEMCKKYAKGMR